jgi:hypothetical protein
MTEQQIVIERLSNRIASLRTTLEQYENWFAENPEDHDVPVWMSEAATVALAIDDIAQEDSQLSGLSS